MKFISAILLFFLSVLITDVHGMGEKLSPVAEISIITCSPGEELYSVFAHSAIRVSDPMNNIDYIYNYGTFDFGAPDFYLNFARGRLDYMLSVEHFKNFKQGYIDEGRSVSEQVLDITHPEKQQLFSMLEVNAKPENRFYRYDFFYDNCATRIRDILQKALHNNIRFPDLKGKNRFSFRELIIPYMVYQKWSDLGINLLLGLPADKEVQSLQYMFLPDQLQKAVQDAVLKHSGKPLVKAVNIIHEIKGPVADTTATVTPNTAFWGLFVIVAIVSLLLWKKNPVRYWFDFPLFLIFGLLGLLVLLMWVFTDHKATVWNLNILWALPSHLVFAFFLLKKNKPRFLNFYFLGTSLLSVILLLSYKALPQGLNISTIPLMLIIMTRSFIIFWKENRD